MDPILTVVVMGLAGAALVAGDGATSKPAPSHITGGDSPTSRNIYDFRVATIDGDPKSLADYRGRTLLIVNTASQGHRAALCLPHASLHKRSPEPRPRPNKEEPLRTVSHVDLARYSGTWYEIASYPQRFQRGCTATTAVYTLREDGKIQVVNRCRRDSLQGREAIARGRARVIDRETNAKLKVSFFWPFWGDYWIIDLDPDYRYAVVGHPNRKYLWILSRTRTMDPLVYAGILERLTAQGYDVARLRVTLQPQEPAGP